MGFMKACIHNYALCLVPYALKKGLTTVPKDGNIALAFRECDGE